MAAKMGMQRCAASSQWLNERISLSRYAHVFLFLICMETVLVHLCVCLYKYELFNSAGQVPLGNFEPDWLIFTADVFFSRALRDQQQVLG